MTTREEKQRRMQYRKENGTRIIVPPTSPPYLRGPDYLVAHACFSCRVSFKVRPMDDQSTCPQCSGALHEMGRSFKAPKKADDEQWKKVELIWNAGFRFPTNSYGADAEPLPDRLRDLAAFIKNNPRHPFRLRSYWPKR